jgi:hypothetical protein
MDFCQEKKNTVEYSYSTLDIHLLYIHTSSTYVMLRIKAHVQLLCVRWDTENLYKCNVTVLLMLYGSVVYTKTVWDLRRIVKRRKMMNISSLLYIRLFF